MAYTTIKKPSDYFNTVAYTGTGSSQDISVGFQTDLTWIKQRSGTENHNIFDTVRTATKRISSNRTNAEDTQSQQLTAFGSDGFTVGTDAGANFNGGTYASWNWLAGGTGVSNTDGSITSTVSANTTSGFSIVKYTGTATNPEQIGHGLGVAPKVIFLKALDGVENWFVDISALTGTTNHFLHLNLNNAAFTTSNGIQNIGNSTFDINGPGGHINSDGRNYIAYCFAEVKGFSKFGSWTGSTNPFIYTGFTPAFILGKNATNSAGYDWWIVDNKRDTINDNSINFLRPNASDAEQTVTTSPVTFLSNGFTLGTTENTFNGSGETMIYMAFAEEPLVGDNPATAR
jgi:hypothetical protein